MSAVRENRRSDALRWGGCFALVVCLHAGGAAALLARWSDDPDLVANAPVIMVDLAPEAVAPDVTPTEVPPDMVLSKQAEPEPEPQEEKPLEKMELRPEPKAEVTLPVEPPKPIEKPKIKKILQKIASVMRAPTAADKRAERAAGPNAGANASSLISNWKSELVARLERHKRAPPGGDRGTAYLTFSIDRSGGVRNVRIARSSGSSALDNETLSLPQRAAPFPPPPPDQSGVVNVPIRYK